MQFTRFPCENARNADMLFCKYGDRVRMFYTVSRESFPSAPLTRHVAVLISTIESAFRYVDTKSALHLYLVTFHLFLVTFHLYSVYTSLPCCRHNFKNTLLQALKRHDPTMQAHRGCPWVMALYISVNPNHCISLLTPTPTLQVILERCDDDPQVLTTTHCNEHC